MGARLVVATVLVATLASPSCGGSDDDERPAQPAAPERSAGAPVQNAAARGFVTAVNSGGTDRVMATLTDDAVVIDSGRRFADPQAIRDWLDAEVTGPDGHITVDRERPNAERHSADGRLPIVFVRRRRPALRVRDARRPRDTPHARGLTSDAPPAHSARTRIDLPFLRVRPQFTPTQRSEQAPASARRARA